MKLNIFSMLELQTDPDQVLTHLVIAADDRGTGARTVCGTEPAELEPAEIPIQLALLCPGCFLYFTRTLAAHYHLPLEGPPGFPPLEREKPTSDA